MIKVSTTGITVSSKTDLRFPFSGQQGQESRIIHMVVPDNGQIVQLVEELYYGLLEYDNSDK